MNAYILCVGALREIWQRDGCAEYLKRLAKYGKYVLEQVDDAPDGKSPAEIAKAVSREGAQILKRIRPTDYVIALCIRAPMPTSPALAEKIGAWEMLGRRVVFVIGGSNGLCADVLARADEKLSFSPLTFPHGLARVLLLEQLYRAEKIRAGEKYHK